MVTRWKFGRVFAYPCSYQYVCSGYSRVVLSSVRMFGHWPCVCCGYLRVLLSSVRMSGHWPCVLWLLESIFVECSHVQSLAVCVCVVVTWEYFRRVFACPVTGRVCVCCGYLRVLLSSVRMSGRWPCECCGYLRVLLSSVCMSGHWSCMFVATENGNK